MATLSLSARLDITAAKALARDLRKLSGQPLEIDASAVEHLGGLCLQVLLAAAQDWRQRRVGLHLGAQSTAFAAALKQFGLSPTALENGTKR